MLGLFALYAGTLFSAAAPAHGADPAAALPIIDLGYALHQAISYDPAGDTYNFTNIRYARSPTGDLRWRAPQPPLPDRRTVSNGAEPRTCPQGLPDWQTRAFVPIATYQSGAVPFNLQAYEAAFAAAVAPPGVDQILNAAVTEDCLFLDVIVPRKVLEQAKADPEGKRGASVMAWIHGGGYTVGSKIGSPFPQFNPSGLQAKGAATGGLIFVGINYRLGAFGWLAGPEVRAAGGMENAGLLDQRLALEWIQKHIARFGGSPNRVTAAGESAGAGSTLLQQTAYGGARGPVPFVQNLAQSSGNVALTTQGPGVTQGFLARAGAASVAAARALPAQTLIRANAAQIKAAPYNTYLYGPVVDGSFVPAPAVELLRRGAFDRSVKVLTGQNSMEGAFFWDPSVKTEAQFRRWLKDTVAGLSPADIDTLVTRIYPPVFDGSAGYVDQATRQMAVFSEAEFDVNSISLHQATGGRSYAYEFAVSPGFHGQDLAYTFSTPPPPYAASAQEALQQVVASFVTTGVPTIPGVEAFPQWGGGKKLVNITATANTLSSSNVNMTRIAYWQQLAKR